MSNHKVSPQLPPTENVRKRGDFMQALGYRSGTANGILAIFDTIGAAPDAADLPDGVVVLVRDASDLNLYATDSGSWKQILE